MRRSPFLRKAPPAPVRPDRSDEFASFEPGRAAARMATDLAVGDPIIVAKDDPVRSKEYRRYVAALPCYRCGAVGRSQAAHGDEGKGMAIKSSDLTCWPGCGPFGDYPGCHYVVGTSGAFTREHRREYEKLAALATIETLREMSLSDAKLRAVLVKVGLLP